MLRGLEFFARSCLRTRAPSGSGTSLFSIVMFCSFVGTDTYSATLLNNNFVAFAKQGGFEAFYDANYEMTDSSGYRLVNVKVTGFSSTFRSWIHTNYRGAEFADYALIQYSVDCASKTVAEHLMVFYDANGNDLGSHDAREQMTQPMATTVKFDLLLAICKLENPARSISDASASGSDSLIMAPGVHVSLQSDGGTYLVPVTVNNALNLNCTVDSGASVVVIPNNVFSKLTNSGAIKQSDIIGQGTFTLADGSKVTSTIFVIRELEVGTTAISNVLAGVTPEGSVSLLGESFLSRFKSWMIDNYSHELVLLAGPKNKVSDIGQANGNIGSAPDGP